MDGDGHEDLVVASFGNYLGRLSWYGRSAGGGYVEHILLSRPGALCVFAPPVRRGARQSLLVLMAQAREGVYRLDPTGGEDFEETPLLQFPPVYGCTHAEWIDFNGDGALDLLLTNGDNGEYASPFKNYHGIRLYLNDGRGGLSLAWFYPLNGAFKAVAADFDGDGDLDIAAISFFPDFGRSPEEAFLYLENLGGMKFKASTIPLGTQGRWLTMEAGDLDGDGDLDIILGSFTQGPASVPIPQAIREGWLTNEAGLLFLENVGVERGQRNPVQRGDKERR